MKSLWLVGLVMLSVACSHTSGDRTIASEKGNEIGNRLIIDNREVYVKTKKDHGIYFGSTGYQLLIEDNILYIRLDEDMRRNEKTAEKIPLASFSESNKSLRISQNEFKIKILKEEKDRDFDAKTCSHMGCLPIPNVQTTFRQLVEVPTLDNQVLCYNRDYLKDYDTWSKGNCPEPSIVSDKGNEIGNRLIIDNREVYVKTKKDHGIYFGSTGYELSIEDNILYIRLDEDMRRNEKTAEKIPLASFAESEKSVRVSKNEFKIKIIKDKKDRDFSAKTCSHMGCLPIPSVDTTFRQLVEVPTLDNQVLCYNRDYFKDLDTWSRGNCPEP